MGSRSSILNRKVVLTCFMKKVTYQQVADALNISRVTVWKAVNDKPGISPDTKRMILQKAVEMGYPVSILNQGIQEDSFHATKDSFNDSSKKISNVAVVVSRPETSNFWMSIIHYQAITLASQGINLMYVYLPPTYSDTFTLPPCLTDGSVSGIIVMNIYDPRLFSALNDLSITKVFLDCPTNTIFSTLNGDLFLIEGRANTEEIVEHMIESGKKRIHFIGDIAYAQTNRERYLGYLKAMQRHQLSVNEIDNLISPIGIDQYKETISAYLDRIIKRSDAIVCANDYIASLVLQYCQKNKISVPNDLYVSGFDDNQEFNNSIALTSVHVNNDRIGVHLANRLVHRLTHPDDDYEYTYIRSRTVYRESTND